MKKYTTLPNDFSAVVADILASEQATINDETVYNRVNTVLMLATENVGATYPSIEAALADDSIVIDAVARRRIIDKMDFIYTVLSCDQIIIPLSNADDCTFNVYETADGAVLHNPRFPEGVEPNNGMYDEADCTLLESIAITSPIFVKAGTVWNIETNTKDKVASLLLLLSKGDNSSYFA